jgi:nitroreductase
MKSIDALKWRYATKKFNPEEILSEEKIDILKEAFNLTPTSYGLQPLRLLVISDKELQKELTSASYNQSQVQNASHVLVICIETEIDEHFIERNFERIKEVRNTPDEILAPYKGFLKSDFAKKTASQIEAWSTNQAYLALGNILTVCAYEGIDACPMEGFVPEKYVDILDLGKLQLLPKLVIPVGIRAEDDLFASLEKVRRPLAETVIDLSQVEKQ